MLTLINICNYLDRYLINALLPLLTVEFHLSHQQGGTVTAAFVVGYVIFSPIFGFLGDRFHRPTLMCIGVVLWALATAASGLASSLILLLIARIMVGVGEASYGTIAPGYIKDFESDPVRLNKLLSVFFTAIPVGSALGYVLGGFLAEKVSWRGSFYWAALPAFVLGFVILLFPEARKTSEEPLPIVSGIRKISAHSMLRYAIGGYILNTFALTSIAAFIASYGEELGFTLGEINSAFGIILVVTGFIGTLAGGRGASWIASKNSMKPAAMLQFVAMLSFAAVPVLGICFLVHSKVLFLILCAIAELFIFAALAPINTIIVVESPPELVTLTQGATIFMINVFGSFLGPQVIGFCADRFGLAGGLQGTTLAMAACAFIWWVGATKHLNRERSGIVL